MTDDYGTSNTCVSESISNCALYDITRISGEQVCTACDANYFLLFERNECIPTLDFCWIHDPHS